MDLARANTIEASTWSGEVALLPVGSVEQHGPHAPLGTDVITATAVADAAVERSAEPILRAPAIPVGVAEEHRHFAGTLWVEPDTFREYVGETVASLASHGLETIVIVNGHGGNAPALREVGARLTRDEVATVVPFTWFEALPDWRSGMGHAGEWETSIVLATRPELVRTERLDDASEAAADRWGTWTGGTNLAYDTEEFAPNGVVGDPSDASEHRGEELLEAATAALLEVIEALRDRSSNRSSDDPSARSSSN